MSKHAASAYERKNTEIIQIKPPRWSFVKKKKEGKEGKITDVFAEDATRSLINTRKRNRRN